MAQITATKGNLLSAKKSYDLASMGYDLLDRKRNVLIREMMGLVDEVKLLRDNITQCYETGYYLLQQANISMGVITDLVKQIPIDDGIEITYRSVMGVEIPKVIYKEQPIKPTYDFASSNSRVDEAYIQFAKVKSMTLKLAEIDSSACRLANAIRKTQKRANALKNIVIPNYEVTIKFISDALEEKEREEFSRLKVIKAQKANKESRKES